jgi:hypothetical protein
LHVDLTGRAVRRRESVIDMGRSGVGKVTAVVVAAAAVLATAGAAGAGSSLPRCTTRVLSATHTRHVIGAGNGAEQIVFTNIGRRACILGGFPGVSYVARSGRQLGAAADREGPSYGRVRLAPGGHARARLSFINNVSAVPGCYHPAQQATAAGLRVYPPGSTLAMYVPDRHPACTRASVHLLHIEAVRAR